MKNKKNIEFYQRAQQNLIDMSLNDPTSIIAKEHGLMGLTRILLCMDQLGIKDGDCKILALPDYTITRNETRWSAGFSYGSILSIKSPEAPFIPLDVLPNCCGITFAEIQAMPKDIYSLKHNINQLIESYTEIDVTDFKRGNHFMGLYSNNNKYYILLHGSLKYTKNRLREYSQQQNNIDSINILGTPFRFAYGDKAIRYYNNCQDQESLSLKYRELIIKDLFPSAHILFNQTHQGFYDINTILLGAYASSEPFNCPIMLTPECDLSIVNINKPISIWGNDIYCSPHGGGYAITGVAGVKNYNYSQNNEPADFLLEFSNGALMLTNNLIDMPYHYRNNTDVCWCDKYNMGSVIEQMTPIYNFKI